MTGFGRTGDYFACLKAQVEPDIICLSKGITGGFTPLAATVCSDHIYNTFNTDDPLKTFWHAHSYTGNPIGCAAGLASWDLLVQNEERFKNLEPVHLKNMEKLAHHPRLKNFRVKGTIAAVDIVNDEEDGYYNSIATYIKKECLDLGYLFRPLGNTFYLMPPYCVSSDEIDGMYAALKQLVGK